MMFAGGAAAVIATVLAVRKTTPASAEPAVSGGERTFFSLSSSRTLRSELQSARGELTLARAQVERANKIMQYSNTYDVTAGMAGSIFDASLREGIDPDLAFRLVRVESQFNPRAVSKVGAVGLTQLMPSTAMLLQKGVSRDQLFDRDTNLKLGFHFLKGLLDRYDGNLHLALLAYNRGEDAVTRDVRAGVNPGNGYDRSVIGSYQGDGISK
jgi:hypothetical protein